MFVCVCVCAYKRILNAFCKRICRWAAYGRPTTQIPRQVGGWSMQGNEIRSFFLFFYNKTEADEINESVKIKLQSWRLCWESLQFSIEIRVEFMWIAL